MIFVLISSQKWTALSTSVGCLIANVLEVIDGILLIGNFGQASEVVSASKAIKIQTLPPVLIIHFMRFSYGTHGSGKLNKAVKYFNSLTIGRELLASSSGPAVEV